MDEFRHTLIQEGILHPGEDDHYSLCRFLKVQLCSGRLVGARSRSALECRPGSL